MDGKNCFRTRWAQEPLFSGGNIVTLALPQESSNDCDFAHPTRYTEALVLACGDKVSVVHVDTGAVYCSYTLPMEDVILHLDAVSVRTERSMAKSNEIDPGESGARPGYVAGAHLHQTIASSQSQRAEALGTATWVPRGSYIAVGTRSLQIYVLRVDAITEDGSYGTNNNSDGDKSTNCCAKAHDEIHTLNSGNALEHDTRYIIRLVQSWTAAQHAIALVCFADTAHALVSCATDGGIKVWDVFHHHLTHNLRCPTPSRVTAVHLNPTATLLTVGTTEGHVSVFDFVHKRVLTEVRAHVQSVEAVIAAASSNAEAQPHGSFFFSVAQDRKVAVLRYDAATRSLMVQRTIVLKEHVSCAVFDAAGPVSAAEGAEVVTNGLRLHVGSADGAVVTYTVDAKAALRVWARRLSNPVARVESHTEEAFVRSLAVAQRPKGVHAKLHEEYTDHDDDACHEEAGDEATPTAHRRCRTSHDSNRDDAAEESSDDEHPNPSSRPGGSSTTAIDAIHGGGASNTGRSRATKQDSEEACLHHRGSHFCRRRVRAHGDSPTSSAAAPQTCLYVADAGFNISALVEYKPDDEPAEATSADRTHGHGEPAAVRNGVGRYEAAHTLVGFLDQVLDVKLLPSFYRLPQSPMTWANAADPTVVAIDDRVRVVVSNSNEVRLYGSTGSVSRHVLRGHSDTVLCCAVSGDGRLIATAGKDTTVRFWCTQRCTTVAVGVKGHTADVTALCFDVPTTATTLWRSVVSSSLSDSHAVSTSSAGAGAVEAVVPPPPALLFSIAMDENLRVWDVAHEVLPCLPSGPAAVVPSAEDTPAAKRVRAEAQSPQTSFNNAPDHSLLRYAGGTSVQTDRRATDKKKDTSDAVQITHRWGVNTAHTGAVYAMAVAPNRQHVATGGKDKLVHLWSVRAGGRVYKDATLTGHRRGIAALTFSPTDRVLASSASDGAVRLWSLVSLTCVRTLQVDRSAVLQLAFFNAGTQLVTGNAEGVLRVWGVATAESVWSSELHRDKIWALCVMEERSSALDTQGHLSASGKTHHAANEGEDDTPTGTKKNKKADNAYKDDGTDKTDEESGDEESRDRAGRVGADGHGDESATGERNALGDGLATLFLTGSADGVLIATEDFTAEAAQQARQDRRELVEKEQELANALRLGRYADAFALALRLSHPRHLRQVMASWSAKDATTCANTLRDTLLPQLDADSLRRLLQYTREWMTNSRHCAVASLVTRAFLRSYHMMDIAAMPEMASLVAPLLAYLQKHSQRQHQLLRRTYYLDYLTRTLSPNMLTSLPPFVTPINPAETRE